MRDADSELTADSEPPAVASRLRGAASAGEACCGGPCSGSARRTGIATPLQLMRKLELDLARRRTEALLGRHCCRRALLLLLLQLLVHGRAARSLAALAWRRRRCLVVARCRALEEDQSEHMGVQVLSGKLVATIQHLVLQR